MLPFEFTVDGPPVSDQAKKTVRGKVRLLAWKKRVRHAAEQRWPEATSPLTEPLEIVVTYFHERPAVQMDTDNMVKPIQDALIGLIYKDDVQLTDTKLRKTSLDGAFHLRGISMLVAEAFNRNHEFLHVVIRAQPSHTEFLS